MYSDISDTVNSADVIKNSVESADDDNRDMAEELQNVFDEMIQLNENYVGYINIENTNIQYPVVQGSDNKFYMTHDVTGKTNSRGSIFMDYRNNSDFSDDNTVIYGHNMRDKSMFNQLTKFEDEQFAKDSSPIFVIRENEILEYVVFASYVVSEDIDYITLNFRNERDFDQYISQVKGHTKINIDCDVKYKDRLLTLSTCSGINSEYRYVVHAVLR